jgi:long-chain acyl-CoA synthetase
VLLAGGTPLSIYNSSAPEQIHQLAAHSRARIAVVDDIGFLERLLKVRDELPELRAVVVADDPDGLAPADVHRLGDLTDDPVDLDAAVEAVDPHDLVTVIYTSGTTGPPKGCMLTHKNLVTAALRVKTHIEGQTDTVLLFLPLAHSFARIVHHSAASRGATLALVADAARVPEAIARVRPTILPAVPRVYEKVHANVLGEIERSSGAKRAIGRWALGIGARASRLRRDHRPVPLALRIQERLADRLVFAKVRERLGGHLRLGVSGAAPLGIDVLEFFHSLGMLVIEGYGLTETSSSLSVNDPDDYRFGTVGRAVDGCDVKLDVDGEILVRSETIFTGYYKDPDATAAAFTDDGWFRTGDVGELDEDGWLKITDRKKDLIITAGGKNIAPQNLENALKASRFISQAVVIGDRRPYVTALITLDPAEIDSAGRGAQEVVQEVVDDVNRDRVRVEQIKRFAILPRDFSQEEGELTPTLKLRRKIVHEHFADEIENLYA